MQNYKDTNGVVHYLSDIDIENGGKDLLPAGCVEITQAEADAISNPPPTLAQARAAQVAELTAAYNAAVQASVSFTAEGGVTKTFQTDSNSRDLLSFAVAGYSAQQAVPAGFYWKSEDNAQVPFTLADLNGLLAAVLAQDWAGFQQLTTLKTQVAAAMTVADVEAIVWK